MITQNDIKQIVEKNKELKYEGICWGFGLALGYLILMGALLS